MNYATANNIQDEFIAGPVSEMRENLLSTTKEYTGSIRNCQRCTHQKVCIIWSLFKGNIENKGPYLISSPIIDSNDLAKICRMYEEKRDL